MPRKPAPPAKAVDSEAANSPMRSKSRWWSWLAVCASVVFVYALPLYHTYELRHISDSLSTKYLDQFPKNIDDITAFISKTDNELLIQSDVFTYGVFSHPTRWEDYHSELQRLLTRKVPVAIYVACYDSTKLVDQLNKQFSFDTIALFARKSMTDPADTIAFDYRLDSIKRNVMDTMKLSAIRKDGMSPREKWSRFREFFVNSLGLKFGDPHELSTTDEFVAFLIRYNEHVLRSLADSHKSFCILPRVNHDLSTFAWYRDEREAVFSMTSYRAGASEFSFETHDDDFIEAVLTKKDRDWKQQKCYEPPKSQQIRPDARPL